MFNIPPGKYFISHSYQDAESVDDMIEILPSGVEPFIFPKLEPDPREFVSNPLIEAILGCDGLIFLGGGRSEQSFWVAFERDYAVRASKRVYEYNPNRKIFAQYTKPPLDLPIYFSMSVPDQRKRRHVEPHKTVREIMQFLYNERFFYSMFTEGKMFGKGDWEQEIRAEIDNRLNQGGYVVVFWSATANQSPATKFELSYLNETNQTDRCVFVRLDETPLPIPNHQDDLVVSLMAKEDLSTLNRVDDLVVRLYWLIFQNQTQFGV